MGKKYKQHAKENEVVETALAETAETQNQQEEEAPTQQKFIKFNQRSMYHIEQSLNRLKQIEQDCGWYVDEEKDELVLECEIFPDTKVIRFTNPRNVTASIDFYVQGIVNGREWERLEQEAKNTQTEAQSA